MSLVNSSEDFLIMINNSYDIYKEYGSRSSKKVDIIHSFILNKIKKFFTDERYEVNTEINVPSSNSKQIKRCDIVVYDKINKEYILVIPVKFVCSNFKQNKNNYLENCIGECFTLKQKNKNLKIIVYNILIQNCPYFNKKKKIIKYENITEEDLKSYKFNENIMTYDYSINILLKLDENNKKISDIIKYENIEEVINNIYKIDL